MTDPLSPIHALLIGIDYYEPNRLYKSLKGAVRDINLVETFLKTTLKLPSHNIRKLISPHPADDILLSARSADALSPTYETIIQSFHTITATAQPGEQVYIHYAGHGGRALTVYPNLKLGSGDRYDEGLVPMDIGDTSADRYIRDVEMTTLLKRMTDKGLIVTIVLDSCHSGGATRGDAEIRSSIDPDRSLRSAESLVADLEELERNWLELTRHHGVSVAGLPQTRDYVLLAACRDNEYAYEYAVNGGTQRHGALTYWMIDTLTSIATTGQPLSYKLLHDRVNAQIQSKFPQQTPMIVGASDRLVFGSSQWSTPFTVTVIKVDATHTQVTLNAGQAQGLSKGTRFAIYPLNTIDFTVPEQQVAIVEIARLSGATESIARVLKPEEGGIAVQGQLEPGAPAIMVAAPINLVQRVRFFAEKTAGEQEHELPAQFVDRQSAVLDQVRQALVGNGWVVEVQAEEAALYQVAIDRQGNYEICQNGRPIENLRPLLSIDDAVAPQRVVDRLVHLAKYQAVQSLDNSSSKLAQAIEVTLLNEDRMPFENTNDIVVKNGDVVCLRLTNRGSQPLKVAVLDLEPTWEISQLPLGGFESPFFNLDSGAEEELLFAMSLPEDAAYDRAKETFKVFAVQKGLADFRWLTLPPLDEPPAPRAAVLEAELANQMEHATRSVTRGEAAAEGINPLNDLLKMIGADLDQAPTVPRAATLVVDPKQDWATKQVRVVMS